MAKQYRRNKLRNWIQGAWTVVTNGYLVGFVKGRIWQGDSKSVCVPGLNCYSCPGALGACPIGSLQAELAAREIRFPFYVTGFLLAFGALFGRFVCGFLCPFGWVQDLLYKIPSRKIGAFRYDRLLRYLKFVVLAVLVILLPSIVKNAAGVGTPWFCKWVCPSGTLFAGIPLLLANPTLRAVVGFIFSWKMGDLDLNSWAFRVSVSARFANIFVRLARHTRCSTKRRSIASSWMKARARIAACASVSAIWASIHRKRRTIWSASVAGIA